MPGGDGHYMRNSERGQIGYREGSDRTESLHHRHPGRFDSAVGLAAQFEGVNGRRSGTGVNADGFWIQPLWDFNQVLNRRIRHFGISAP